MNRAIAVMAKKPTAGRSKTRLTPHLDAESAAGVSHSMIVDTVAALQGRDDCTTFIAADSEDGAQWFAERFPTHRILVQRGETLGERLDGVLTDLIEAGFEQAYAVNSDSPDLPAGHLAAAFGTLDDDGTDIVFGPTEDGGYYLIGWKHPWHQVVLDVEMSTSSVLEDSLTVAESISASVALAPSWYDIDDVGDLERFQSTAVMSGRAYETLQFLGRLQP